MLPISSMRQSIVNFDETSWNRYFGGSKVLAEKRSADTSLKGDACISAAGEKVIRAKWGEGSRRSRDSGRKGERIRIAEREKRLIGAREMNRTRQFQF
jgi:hypothetical protein